ATTLQVLGETSSGEVEVVLVKHHGRLLIGVGSDHTDRQVETYNVGVSKQMCDKPIAPRLWEFAEVLCHWDSLILRSWIGTELCLYQEGSVAAMLPPQAIIACFHPEGLDDGTVMFCGTLPTKGGIKPSTHFAFELE